MVGLVSNKTDPWLRSLFGGIFREMRSAGQIYSHLLAEMIEEHKKLSLEQDMKMGENQPDSEFVLLSKIKD